MQDFTGPESGHDHFFAAFGKFAAATSRKGAMLAEDAQRAAAEHEFYLETMVSRQSGAIAALARQVGFDPDLSRMRARPRCQPVARARRLPSGHRLRW